MTYRHLNISEPLIGKEMTSMMMNTGDVHQLSKFVDIVFNENTKNVALSTLVDQLSNHSFLTNLESLINYKFKNPSLLIQSISHRSFIHEYGGERLVSYERLEFLGDAMVDLIVSNDLYVRFPNFKEGKLSRLRASLVNEESLSKIGNYLKLNTVILLGAGELKSDGQNNPSLLADVFEALIGAIFLEAGYVKTVEVFKQIIERFELESGKDFYDDSKLDSFDAKSKLQELTMAIYKETPLYRSSETKTGQFQIELHINNKLMAEGTFASKKNGEKELAKLVINKMN